MWKVLSVTVLEKISVSVTLLETLHLHVLHFFEPTNLSKGYNFSSH